MFIKTAQTIINSILAAYYTARKLSTKAGHFTSPMD